MFGFFKGQEASEKFAVGDRVIVFPKSSLLHGITTMGARGQYMGKLGTVRYVNYEHPVTYFVDFDEFDAQVHIEFSASELTLLVN